MVLWLCLVVVFSTLLEGLGESVLLNKWVKRGLQVTSIIVLLMAYVVVLLQIMDTIRRLQLHELPVDRWLIAWFYGSSYNYDAWGPLLLLMLAVIAYSSLHPQRVSGDST